MDYNSVVTDCYYDYLSLHFMIYNIKEDFM